MTRNEYCELLCQYETVSQLMEKYSGKTIDNVAAQLKARIKEGEKNPFSCIPRRGRNYCDGVAYVVGEIRHILDRLHEEGTTIFAWGYVRDRLDQIEKVLNQKSEETWNTTD